ncbi:hypothetical protein WH52_07870 [Tenacibaculum holothuriorum]|uniref:Uncharacterized protein n=1 Tax=Tenacibaculum holothuriorum TaxID=1635173 RepID=A0A1Y2PCN2_9FLAO|nr:hypothetical protein [Tenacibaculum holothuriorum]OSY87950.1 hypothetical protein WH52_07870 [Tenacibaculum holothuriorum]
MFLKKVNVDEREHERALKFPKINVLDQRIDQVNELLKFKRAFFLENSNREMLKIYVTDNSGLHKIETSVWTISEKGIIIKNDTVVPFGDIVAVA